MAYQVASHLTGGRQAIIGELAALPRRCRLRFRYVISPYEAGRHGASSTVL